MISVMSDTPQWPVCAFCGPYCVHQMLHVNYLTYLYHHHIKDYLAHHPIPLMEIWFCVEILAKHGEHMPIYYKK